MSYVEYRSWQIYYMLEPWGWHNEEYRTAAVVAMIHNANVTKKRDLKSPLDFMRDMQGAVLKETQPDMVVDEEMSDEDRQRLIAQVKKDFGI